MDFVATRSSRLTASCHCSPNPQAVMAVLYVILVGVVRLPARLDKSQSLRCSSNDQQDMTFENKTCRFGRFP